MTHGLQLDHFKYIFYEYDLKISHRFKVYMFEISSIIVEIIAVMY